MKKPIKTTWALAACITVLIAACTDTAEKRAGQLYHEAENALAAGDLSLAKAKLDSIDKHSKETLEWRKLGHQLNYRVELAQQEDSLATADTMLIAVTQMINEMVQNGNFVFEKSEYDDLGRWFVKGTDTPHNLERCYLHASVDEYGHVQLISEYRGSAYINHTRLRLTGGDGTQAVTANVPLSNTGANYQFKNQGLCHESVTYTDDSILGFIDMHSSDQKLKAHLLYKNGSKAYPIVVSTKECQAIALTSQLGKMLAAQLLFTQQSKVAAGKIQFLKAKIEGTKDNGIDETTGNDSVK